MDESRRDSDRVVMIATIILAILCVAMYLIIFLTLARFGVVNDLGRTFAVVALVIGGVVMLLACYLAFAGHNRDLVTLGMSGAGWALVCGGLVIGAPALGMELSGVGSWGGFPAALFLIIAGAALLQAERNARQADEKTA
jgi:hypothetical protein